MSQPAQGAFSVGDADGRSGLVCPHCQRHEAARLTVDRLTVGAFSAQCAGCCARLVRSARPLRGAQEAHMAAITRREGRPTRAQIIDAIKAQDAQ